ncbi:CinA family protein [Kitasatospora sp. MBT63]|uniref:CinA family protein n=1 Tax=Kitasatospora sp. MBT63 TaxID=1444768 RepID=UPI00053AB595|nr:CinA family protein [Kitasatospora sp. MBT63]
MAESLREQEILARQVHSALSAAGSTVSVAESLTGGRLAVALSEAPGASSVFLGSVTAYATEIKAKVLGVSGSLLAERGAVDADVARQMAEGVRKLMRTTYALATTGVAGPAPQDGHEPGTFYVAVAGPLGTAVVRSDIGGTRDEVEHAAVVLALKALHDFLRP